MSRNIIRALAGICLLVLSIGHMEARRLFMTGDSHVFAKIYPSTVEEIIRSRYPDIEFSQWSKNGICFYSFKTNPEYFDSIFSFRPDVLIVHLGTNGAYANNFTRREFRKEMESFYATLTKELPDVKVVFVTPFTNKKRKNKKKGKWYINYQNREAADEIIDFVKAHPNTYVIDNNAEVGLEFLNNPTLIRPDNVHLTEKGYKELGRSVGNKILEIEQIWNP